jgi:hypothetical protein
MKVKRGDDGKMTGAILAERNMIARLFSCEQLFA